MMYGYMITTPHDMRVTFVEDYPGAEIKLLEPAWPARLHICEELLELARSGRTRRFTYDGTTARFDLDNGAATYRRVSDRLVGANYEFECVEWSRDLD